MTIETPPLEQLFDLTGKTILVTGGSRGLGLQMARAFAARGANLIIASRKLDACEQVAQEIRAAGGEAFAAAVHMGKWDEIDRLIESVYAAFTKVDILVNNAGMGPRLASHEVSEDLFDKVMAVNFKGPFRLASQIAKRMFDGSGGSIINISSSAGTKPMPEVVPYAAAKAALNAMTISFAHEYAPKVRVNTIAPGPFLTDISDAWTEDAREKAGNALGRPAVPQEIITSALYLASSASSFTTGAILRVDGGFW